MIKKLTGIITAVLLLLASAAAGAEPVITALSQTALSESGARARGLCRNNNYLFVNCDTAVEIYLCDSEDGGACAYLTKVDFTSSGVKLKVNSLAAYDNDCLVVGYGKGGAGSDTGYSRTIIYDVAEVGATPPEVKAAVKAPDDIKSVQVGIGGEYMFVLNEYFSLAAFKMSDALAFDGATKTYAQMGAACGVFALEAPQSNKSVTSMCVDGDYLYYANRSRLNVLNISDPQDVYCCGYVGINGDLSFAKSSMAVKGNSVFIGTKEVGADGGVYIFDVSQAKTGTAEAPLPPSYTGKIDRAASGAYDAAGICVNGSYLYVSSPSEKTLHLYDISDPAEVRLAASGKIAAANAYGYEGICLCGNKIYCSDRENGIAAFEITDIEVESLSLSSGGKAVTGLTTGEVTADFTAVNYSAAAAEVCIIMAFYKEEELEAITASPQLLPAGERTEISASINAYEEQNCRLKVMLWDNMQNMNLKYVRWNTEDRTKAISAGVDLLPVD